MTMGAVKDLPDDQQIQRYWIELRDRRDASARELPLLAFRLIHLSVTKGAPQLPDEVELQVQDGADVIKARDIDGLAAQLRLRYPDEAYERFLRSERDREAEKRRAEAMNRLIEILAEAVVDDLLREEQGSKANHCGESDSDSRGARHRRRSKRAGT